MEISINFTPNSMKKVIYRVIGIIELFIGITTLTGCFIVKAGILQDVSPKPDATLVFVVITSIISTFLGIGMLRMKNVAKNLLIFFSGYILLTKVFVYTGLIVFTGQFLTFVPQWSIDIVSALYHSAVIVVLIKN